MATTYIHIGTHKTATTVLQKTFYNNRELLLSRGVAYPDSSAILRRPAYKYSHWPVAQWISRRNSTARIGRRIADSVEAPYEKMVLSAENFWGIGNSKSDNDDQRARKTRLIESIRSAFDDKDVKIIVYLRPHVDYLVSHYNQAIKQTDYSVVSVFDGVNQFYTDFVNLFAYRENLALWETHFGRDNMIVRKFVLGDLYRQDIVEDMFSVLGLDASGIERVDRENESWATQFIVLKNELNKEFKGEAARQSKRAIMNAFGEKDLYANDFKAKIEPHIEERHKAQFQSDWDSVMSVYCTS